jgi:hypothetical protein
VPQFIQGIASGSSNTKRLPFAYRVALSNLSANATYRFYNQCVVSGDSATASGAGNVLFANATGFGRTSSPGLSTVGTYGTFTTDANGSYTGWFMNEPTGNAARFTAGMQVYMRIVLNDGNNGTAAKTYLTTTTYATVIAFNTTGANTGTGIRGNSSATAKNFVVLYDNLAGTGQPLAATLVEDDGVAETTANSYVKFYNDSVDASAGAWGAIIPNSNANGVLRIEQRSLADGSLIGFNTDSDGIWPSSAITVNPSGSDTAPIVITITDAALTPGVTTYNLTASAGANGNISPSGVTNVNSGANLTYTITPNASYHVADVLVDNVSVGVVTTYTFTSVMAIHTIAVSFALNTTPVITAIQFNAGNVGIDFTGGASDTIGNFTVLSTTNLLTPMTPDQTATITTSGTGVFHASLPATASAAFFQIKH